MAFLPEIENFITRPAKSGKPKTRDTIATYRGAFKRIFSKLDVTERQLVDASFSPEELVKRIEATDWEESTRLQTAKMVFMFLKDRKVDLPAITEYVDELEARKTLRRGEVRSDDEHEVHYADTVGKLEDVERAVDEFLQSQTKTPLRLSILLAAYLMLIVPLRPKEAVAIYIKRGITLSPNFLDLEQHEITISEQKSVKVGTRLIKVPERFVKLASLRTDWLFPSLRLGSVGPMTRTDFTKQLVHAATLEFFGKSVSSRDLRTSVISNNIDTGMTPLEQAKFAKECGHTLATQLDHYNVFESVPNKPKITIRKKVEKSPPTEPTSQQEPQPKPEQEQVPVEGGDMGKLGSPQRTWNGDVYTLVDIPFAILEKVAELVPCEVRVTADCRNNKYSITLYDVNLKTYVAIERLFVGI